MRRPRRYTTKENTLPLMTWWHHPSLSAVRGLCAGLLSSKRTGRILQHILIAAGQAAASAPAPLRPTTTSPFGCPCRSRQNTLAVFAHLHRCWSARHGSKHHRLVPVLDPPEGLPGKHGAALSRRQPDDARPRPSGLPRPSMPPNAPLVAGIQRRRGPRDLGAWGRFGHLATDRPRENASGRDRRPGDLGMIAWCDWRCSPRIMGTNAWYQRGRSMSADALRRREWRREVA